MQSINTCSVCNASFSRRDNMKRHLFNKHGHHLSSNYQTKSQTNQTLNRSTQFTSMPPEIPHSSEKLQVTSRMLQNTSAFKFQHPCSIVLTGPSGSGKTVLTKKIICEKWIEQPPQRMIWCYGQYQPLYDDMKRQIPGIEFVKGIPDFIEHDTYLDTSTRNCIILDDLMGDAKKDERVANLFTKGSHHRNLTVIFLTQNVFPQGKACRDISLNTKYLVLFNNPVDRYQVMTLARRIYPSTTNAFMKVYEQAVTKPYGHLVVDLRANTPEHERLRPNILEEEIPVDNVSKFIRPPYYHQNSESSGHSSNESSHSSDESDFNLDMPICDDCGIMFGDAHALQQHVKEWCVGRKRKLEDQQSTDDEPEQKKWITLPGDSDNEEEISEEEISEEEDEMPNENDDEQEVFSSMLEKAQDLNNSEWKRKYNKYIDSHMSEDDARNKADEKMMSLYTNDVMQRYTRLIHHICQLQRGSVHRQVMKDVEKYMERNMDETLAIKIAVKRNKPMIETLLETLDTENQSDDETEEPEEDTDD